MAGGIGTRFWPYSKLDKPKQFIDILGVGKSLLQLTFARFEDICPPENIYIVANERYFDIIMQQLPNINNEQVLLEPIGRNTAPCIAFATYKIAKGNPNARIVVAPSDHAIFNEKEFAAVVNTSIEVASKDNKLVTIGIKPSGPNTGYGYIQYLEKDEGVAKKVKTFTEKPELDLAKKFIESGDFLWNAGIFIWSAKAITEGFEKHLPDLADVFLEAQSSFGTENEKGAIEKAYSHSKNVSIDYGILEKANNVYVVPGDFGWNDLGSWNALHEVGDKDSNGNVIDANALIYDSHNCIIKVPKNKLVVIDQLEGFLVVEHEGVLVICKKENDQKFRKFVADVKSQKGDKYL